MGSVGALKSKRKIYLVTKIHGKPSKQPWRAGIIFIFIFIFFFLEDESGCEVSLLGRTDNLEMPHSHGEQIKR